MKKSSEQLTAIARKRLRERGAGGRMTLPDDLARLREWADSDKYRALVERTLVKSGTSIAPRFDARDRAALRRVLASVEDLRDRLALFRGRICESCRCAVTLWDYARCSDCLDADTPDIAVQHEHAGACVSTGLRALCGRRLG